MGEEYLLEEVVSSASEALSDIGEVYQKDVMYWIWYLPLLALLHRRERLKDIAAGSRGSYET